MPNRTKDRAFSLLEVLIVVGLIVILSTMYFSRSSPKKTAVGLAACRANLQKVFISAQIYGNDFHGHFPSRKGAISSEDALNLLVPQYASDTGLFICPAQKPAPRPEDSLVKGRISYAYVM